MGNPGSLIPRPLGQREGRSWKPHSQALRPESGMGNPGRLIPRPLGLRVVWGILVASFPGP